MGLYNGSATCYMNAVFQQLFMQPAVRALILSAPEVPKSARRDSVFYHLQVCTLTCYCYLMSFAMRGPRSCQRSMTLQCKIVRHAATLTALLASAEFSAPSLVQGWASCHKQH